MDDFLSGLMMVGAIVLGLFILAAIWVLQGANARTNTSAPLASAYSDKFRPSFERSVKAGWI